jgi:hypothetical protein
MRETKRNNFTVNTFKGIFTFGERFQIILKNLKNTLKKKLKLA